ncbi:LAFE_0D09648g1_1 [Lachancea fermentati]|uniref:LAFE_0D09648g1_1 n=1 Tax=Lachancea fermentati TaxID=4955 RepID=A0A1G4MBU3_LACFM|nr:LAFE_0D09648g1_1 [Lachancea fermentati]
MSNKENEVPIRLAVLGGSATGKSSLVSRLTMDVVHEQHYPTRKQTNWLFLFEPADPIARTLLDEQAHERIIINNESIESPVFKSPQISPHLLLSPLVFQSFINDWKVSKAQLESGVKPDSGKLITSNGLYSYEKWSNDCKSSLRRASTATLNNSTPTPVLPKGYRPPMYTPISIDIIDTPGFRPDMVVPFLEVSMFRNLDKDILKGLASEPRRPVSTTSLLVASGASELNGKVNGYIFVYSAVPELNHGVYPPGYENANNDSRTTPKEGDDESKPPSGTSTHRDSVSSSKSSTSDRKCSWSSYENEEDGGFSLLSIIRNCILDAWTEFRDYQHRWAQGKEGDVYSLMYNLKQMWKNQSERNEKLKQLRSYKTKLDSIDLDEASPDSPPPVMIVCTHTKDILSSPVLIEWGRNLALEWKCGFVALDSVENYNVDVAVSLLLREVMEKERLLQSSSKGKGKKGLKKIVKG